MLIFIDVTGPITVMCYNVLCEKYATTQMYGYCPSWALSWDYRKKVILGEIRHYTADIITLQVRAYMLTLLNYCFLRLGNFFCTLYTHNIHDTDIKIRTMVIFLYNVIYILHEHLML